jgi:hypothetical protein
MVTELVGAIQFENGAVRQVERFYGFDATEKDAAKDRILGEPGFTLLVLWMLGKLYCALEGDVYAAVVKEPAAGFTAAGIGNDIPVVVRIDIKLQIRYPVVLSALSDPAFGHEGTGEIETLILVKEIVFNQALWVLQRCFQLIGRHTISDLSGLG